MNKEIKDLYVDYKSGRTDRRTFIKKLGLVTGSSYAALAMQNISGDPSFFQEDNDLMTVSIKYPGDTGEIMAFMARPKAGERFPAVIVIHENKGLVPHIRDVTRRMAKEGFLAVAPDALSPLGGTPEDITNVGEMFKKLNSEETTKNFVAAVKYLKTHPNSTGKVGCTGFCW